MSPDRAGKNGSYRFDRVFPGVGRIHRSSGTSKLKEFQRRDQLLTELFEHAQLDALRAFMRGDVTIEELLEAKRAGRLSSASLVADVALRGNLWETFGKLFPAVPRSQKTEHRYRVSFEAFTRKAGPMLGSQARVADLARADWPALAKAWGRSPADWNHLRRMLSAGLTRLLGDVYHPFRRQVVKTIPIAGERPRTPDLSAELFWRIIEHAPEHTRPAYITLLATGMRVGEYLACRAEDLRPFNRAIDVPGTKTAGSRATVYVEDSFWPDVLAAIPAPVTYKWLRIYWTRACVAAGAGRLIPDPKGGIDEEGKPLLRYDGLRIHDLRHAFAQLASDAGESTAKVQAALRHSSPEMTRRYEMQTARRDVAQAVGRALRRA